MRTCELRVESVVGAGMAANVHARLQGDGQLDVAIIFDIDSLDLMLTEEQGDADMFGWMIIEGSTRFRHETEFSGIDNLRNPTIVVPNLGLARQLRQDPGITPPAAAISPGALLARFEVH